jgi:hypothetical protein
MAYPNALQLSTSPDDEPDDPGEPHHHDASAPRLRQTSLASSSLVRALFFNGTTPGSVSQTGRQSLPELYPTIPVARPGLVQHNTFPFANSRLLGSSHYDSPYPPDIVTFASVEPLPRDRRCSATSWTASESTTGPTTPGAPDPHSLYEYENPHHPGKWLQYSTQAIPEHGVLDLGESGVTQMTWWAPQDGSVVAAASISPITHLPPANDSYFPSDEHDTINFTPTLAAVASEIHGLSCQSPPLQPFVSPALLQQVLSPHLHLLETPSHEMPPAYAGTRGLMDSFLPREEHATPPPAPEQVRKRAKSRSPVACTSPRSARVDVESSMATATRIDQELNRCFPCIPQSPSSLTLSQPERRGLFDLPEQAVGRRANRRSHDALVQCQSLRQREAVRSGRIGLIKLIAQPGDTSCPRRPSCSSDPLGSPRSARPAISSTTRSCRFASSSPCLAKSRWSNRSPSR